eukprot:5939959-Prorocentrum_lima.AAC.1
MTLPRSSPVYRALVCVPARFGVCLSSARSSSTHGSDVAWCVVLRKAWAKSPNRPSADLG